MTHVKKLDNDLYMYTIYVENAMYIRSLECIPRSVAEAYPDLAEMDIQARKMASDLLQHLSRMEYTIGLKRADLALQQSDEF